MKKIVLLLSAMAISLLANSIKVEDAYARATPPGLPNTASFMTIKNTGDKDIALIGAKSSVVNVAELHTHDMKDGKMMMYQVPKITIKANSSTTLQPGGFHVMMLGLKQKPLKKGQTVDLELSFSNGEKISLTLPVKTVMGGMMKKHSMKGGMKEGMSCGQGKCGSSMNSSAKNKGTMKKGMSCGQGKCGKN